jgi:hypothetical protein
MNVLTNRLKINFNIDAIKRDFVFVRLERQNQNKKDKWYDINLKYSLIWPNITKKGKSLQMQICGTEFLISTKNTFQKHQVKVIDDQSNISM